MSMRTFSANFHYYDFKHPGADTACKTPVAETASEKYIKTS